MLHFLIGFNARPNLGGFNPPKYFCKFHLKPPSLAIIKKILCSHAGLCYQMQMKYIQARRDDYRYTSARLYYPYAVPITDSGITGRIKGVYSPYSSHLENLTQMCMLLNMF